MDHFSTEEQQIEAIKKFWHENGIPIVVGAVLGLGGLWGWQYYNEKTILSQELASDSYNQVIEELQQGESGFGKAQEFINENADSNYAVLTALQLAKTAIDRSDLTEAEKQLQWASENVKDATLKEMALLRLARVQNEQAQYDAALANLGKIQLEAYQAQVHMVKGDVLVNKGQLVEAQESYAKALDLDASNNLLQMKIDDLNARVAGTQQNG